MEVGIATTAFLILFPVLVALILMFVRDDRARSYITVVGALVIACGSIFCAAQFLSILSSSLLCEQRAGPVQS